MNGPLNLKRPAAAVLKLACTAALLLSAAGAFERPPLEGRYTKADAEHTTLDIRAESDGYVVRLVGGAPEDAAAASPADCYIEARGRPTEGRLRARFAAFQNDVFEFDSATAEREARYVELTFSTDGVEVSRVDIAGYCAPGSRFLGQYLRAPIDQRG